ncbi:hypothetical protein JJQ01_05975 [Enterobacter hormaechei]|nr:hypothetical protein [Enterobacter hormaechei]MBK4427105.1 hypothetical protein [Enterobacter hormaechei]MCU3706088.1 hypothetical protein [Enterobacter hormaechei subsp. steigerwaltii]NYA85942.1 hypothetical protein [Enterobacter hormaechei]HAV1975368.1 hypothetical protein [Enterobacter hormaechei subsp. steigerwaltii]HAV1993354.1 hypothetical protein [Enterobacter hormaechei subsp. steigerwaltii]
MTAALPFGCGLPALLLQIGFLLLAVRPPRFVIRHNSTLSQALSEYLL